MSKGINRVTIVGNLGADPEVRYMPSGVAVCNLSVATSESWKDRQTGARQERTEWHRVTLFGRLAEVSGEYLAKGRMVYVEGSLRTEKYQDKQTGADRWSTSIIAREMQMLGGSGPRDGAGGETRANQATPAGAQVAGAGEWSDDEPF